MKTGAEIVDFKSFNAQNKQSISDFETLRSRQVNDVVKTSDEIFKDEVDTIKDNEPSDEITSDDLSINTGKHINKYHSHPYGNGVAPNMYDDNGTSKVKQFIEFSGN